MHSNQNETLGFCPSMKKKVRIISAKKRALTDCTVDNNEPPQPCFTPKNPNPSSQRGFPQEQTPARPFTDKQTSSAKKAGIKNLQNSEEFEKLLEITSRCVDYFKKFAEEKEAEVKIVRQAFADIHQNLNSAFNNIINEVNSKHKQIQQFLEKKQSQLIKIKNEQEMQLNASLNDVKSIHLVNIFKDYKSGDQSVDIGQELSSYANTLHKFYETMEAVEKHNFKEGVDETINFINNIITEEIKFIIYDKIPNKSLNGSFSFNDGLGFGVSAPGQAHAAIPEQFDQNSISNESIEFRIGQKRPPRPRQIRETWTQTRADESANKLSFLETMKLITGSQAHLKQRLRKYQQALA